MRMVMKLEKIQIRSLKKKYQLVNKIQVANKSLNKTHYSNKIAINQVKRVKVNESKIK